MGERHTVHEFSEALKGNRDSLETLKRGFRAIDKNTSLDCTSVADHMVLLEAGTSDRQGLAEIQLSMRARRSQTS